MLTTGHRVGTVCLALGARRQQWTGQFSAFHFQSHRLHYHSNKKKEKKIELMSARDQSTDQVEVDIEILNYITNADCAFTESERRQVGMPPAAGRVKLLISFKITTATTRCSSSSSRRRRRHNHFGVLAGGLSSEARSRYIVCAQ